MKGDQINLYLFSDRRSSIRLKTFFLVYNMICGDCLCSVEMPFLDLTYLNDKSKDFINKILDCISTSTPYYIQKTSQKYLLQILQICNRIFPNLFAIAICNKRNLIALQFICNKPVIYWTMSADSFYTLEVQKVLLVYFSVYIF